MDNTRAVLIADGAEEATEEETLQAWQHLHDTGLGLHLGGHFAATLKDLIEAGHLVDKRTRH